MVIKHYFCNTPMKMKFWINGRLDWHPPHRYKLPLNHPRSLKTVFHLGNHWTLMKLSKGNFFPAEKFFFLYIYIISLIFSRKHVSTHWNRFGEAIPMNTHLFSWRIKYLENNILDMSRKPHFTALFDIYPRSSGRQTWTKCADRTDAVEHDIW